MIQSPPQNLKVSYIVTKFPTFNEPQFALKLQKMPLIINQIMIQINLSHILNLLSFHPLHHGLF